VKLRYFAWVRERIGKPEEDIEPPPGIATVADLMTWLTAISGAREVAFFPPMTGG
jgi:molybdopterin synthase sulfur carrier subunit